MLSLWPSGTFARGCAQVIQTPRQQEAATAGNTGLNPETLATNNIVPGNVPQIYVLSCTIDDTPVSFLVDTGAGVLLLSKKVWDKLNWTEDKFKPVVSYTANCGGLWYAYQNRG